VRTGERGASLPAVPGGVVDAGPDSMDLKAVLTESPFLERLACGSLGPVQMVETK
jgi:hypothetical protein